MMGQAGACSTGDAGETVPVSIACVARDLEGSAAGLEASGLLCMSSTLQHHRRALELTLRDRGKGAHKRPLDKLVRGLME